MEIIKYIGSFIASAALSVSGVFGVHSQPVEAPLVGDYNPAAGGTYRLQTSIGSVDTSIRLSSFKEPISGLNITMSSLNSSIAYGTLDPLNPTRKEFVSFTGITQNSDGTATLTGVTRGLAFLYPFTASSTLRQSHAGQSIFILSDAPQVFNEYAVKRNNETISGTYTFTGGLVTNASSTLIGATLINTASSSFAGTTTLQKGALVTTPYRCTAGSDSNQLCEKAYIDAQVVAGGTDASYTIKGVSERATVDEINAGTGTGGTGAALFVNPADLQYTTYASTTSNTLAATTTTYNVGTTTISFNLADSLNAPFIRLFFMATTTTAATGNICVTFNGESTGTNYNYSLNATYKSDTGSANAANTRQICGFVNTPGSANSVALQMDIVNLNGFAKFGTISASNAATVVSDIQGIYVGQFRWASTSPITSISITSNSATGIFGTTTYMQVSKN